MEEGIVDLEDCVNSFENVNIISKTNLQDVVFWCVTTSTNRKEIESILLTFFKHDTKEKNATIQNGDKFNISNSYLIEGSQYSIGFAYGGKEDLLNLKLNPEKYNLVIISKISKGQM